MLTCGVTAPALRTGTLDVITGMSKTKRVAKGGNSFFVHMSENIMAFKLLI